MGGRNARHGSRLAFAWLVRTTCTDEPRTLIGQRAYRAVVASADRDCAGTDYRLRRAIFFRQRQHMDYVL